MRRLPLSVEAPDGVNLQDLYAWCRGRWGMMCADNGWFGFGGRFCFDDVEKFDAFRAAFDLSDETNAEG